MTRSIKNLIAAILISVSGYLSWTQIVPAYSIKEFLETKIEEKRTTVVSKNDIIKRIDEVQAELGTKYSELQRLSLVAPKDKGLAEIISSVESIYVQSGVILPEITLGSQINKSQANFNEITFETRNDGTYRQILNVLSFLEKNIRILDLDSISMSLTTKAKTEAQPDPELSLLLRGKFYWLKNAEPESSSGPAVIREEE